MSRLHKLIAALLVAIACIGGWIAYRLVYTLQHIPEAYAAWDTGTLLIDYMEHNQDKWPTSWDEVLGVLGTDRGRAIPLRGSQAGDLQYAQSLKEIVEIDWAFDPTHADSGAPVTRTGGGSFPITWESAEPNEMIREYLRRQAIQQ